MQRDIGVMVERQSGQFGANGVQGCLRIKRVGIGGLVGRGRRGRRGRACGLWLAGTSEMRIGRNLSGIDPVKVSHAAGDGGKFHGFEKAHQLLRISIHQTQLIERGDQGHIAHQPHQFFRDAN